ncbi:DUF2335 domain-containing protein [Streptomyces europaeiscabiei]|nr:DUF2335 domain-containing protein [Streptomyces europaeiscabiei]
MYRYISFSSARNEPERVREVVLPHDDEHGAHEHGAQVPQDNPQPDRRPDGGIQPPLTGPVTQPRPHQDSAPRSDDRSGLDYRGSSYGASGQVRRRDVNVDGVADADEIVVHVRQEHSAWSGPLPPAGVLAEYEQLVPGSADRIIGMAEVATTGHIETAKKVADAEIEATQWGMRFAFTLTILAMIASFVFFVRGDEIAGAAFLSFPIAMIVKSFIDRNKG